MEIKIQELQSGAKKVDPIQKKEVDKLYDISSKEWKKRKKMVSLFIFIYMKCMDIVNTLCDASGQRPSDFFEELGLEQDS